MKLTNRYSVVGEKENENSPKKKKAGDIPDYTIDIIAMLIQDKRQEKEERKT